MATSNGASNANSTKEPTPGDGPAAANEATTGALASRAKEALDAWQTLEKALANISSHKRVFSVVAEAVDRHVATEIEIQDKNAHIARLQSAIQIQLEEVEKRFSKWNIEKGELQRKIEKKDAASEAKLKALEQSLKAEHAQEMEMLKKALEDERKKSAALGMKLSDAKLRSKKAEDELAKCKEEVEDWNDYVSELKEVDFKKFGAKIKPLSDRCCNLARKYFFRDLHESYFLDSEWDLKTRDLGIPLTFPPSNSRVAKYVRMAACLHIISRILCTDIFKPCYIPKSASFSIGIKEILATQFLDEVAKERITRALILSTYPADDTIMAMTETAGTSSSQIETLLKPLGANEEFANELKEIFLDAGEIWKDSAQHSDKMIEALIEDDIPGNPWAIMDEFTIPTNNTTPTTTTNYANDDPLRSSMLNLFPCIYVPEDERTVFPGVMLLYGQGIVSAAEQEFNECLVARRPRIVWSNTNAFPGGPTTTRRERRMSSVTDGKGGILTTSFAATTAAG